MSITTQITINEEEKTSECRIFRGGKEKTCLIYGNGLVEWSETDKVVTIPHITILQNVQNKLANWSQFVQSSLTLVPDGETNKKFTLRWDRTEDQYNMTIIFRGDESNFHVKVEFIFETGIIYIRPKRRMTVTWREWLLVRRYFAMFIDDVLHKEQKI